MLHRLFAKSLARRLVLASLVAATALLLFAGALLFWMFRSTLERQFDARLESLLNGLLANVEQAKDGHLYLQAKLSDPAFALPASGWYWQITPLRKATVGRVLASPSLLEKRFDIHRFDHLPRSANGTTHVTTLGPHGRPVRVLEQRLSLFGDGNLHSVLVAGDIRWLDREIASFGNAILILFSLFSIGLALAIFVQVRFGLRPLKLLHDEIADVRDGRRQRLSGEFPAEIQPVVDELNQLIRANREVVERARTQVGNLAHALKTPLAVLINEATTRENDELAKLVRDQSVRMREQLDLYLERARRAALAGTLGVTTPIRQTLAPLLKALGRIYRERAMQVRMDCPEGLLFRGEKQDLEEMLGNLLDNAFKYGATHIQVSCRKHGRQVVITVEDDGPGLTEEQCRRALQRGKRLDEASPGSGLGLSIVKELASIYHGELSFGASALGGLKVVLRLPAVS